MKKKDPEPVDSSLSKTFDRGLSALEFIAKNAGGVTITEISQHMELHRTIVHRLVGTLERHNLVARIAGTTIVPAIGLVYLASSVSRDLQEISRPILQRLANTTECTAFLVRKVNEAEVQSLMVIEPQFGHAHISYRPLHVNPIELGASGKAILAGGPPIPGEPEEATAARRRGYALSHDEVVPAAWGIATSIPKEGGYPTMAIGITALVNSKFDDFAPLLIESANELSTLISDDGL